MVLFSFHLSIKEIKHISFKILSIHCLPQLGILLKQICQPTEAFQKNIGNGKNNQRSWKPWILMHLNCYSTAGDPATSASLSEMKQDGRL